MKQFIAIFFLLIFNASLSFCQVSFVYNTLADIKKSEGNVELKRLKVWGGSQRNDENMQFVRPRDIDFDQQDRAYILDSGNHRIQVFDNKGNYIRTIGQKGQGPMEFLEPSSCKVKNGYLFVADTRNGRVQRIALSNDKIKTYNPSNSDFRKIAITNEGHFILQSSSTGAGINPLLFEFNPDGKLHREFGKTVPMEGDYILQSYRNDILFSVDGNNNIYVAHIVSYPEVKKYSPSGKLVYTMKYELPFEPDAITFDGRDITGTPIISGFDVDESGNVFLIANTRKKTDEENKIGASLAVGKNIIYIQPDIEVNETDLYKLLIFDPNGRMIAAKQLDFYCHSIKVHQNKLFFIDTYIDMVVREYYFILKS